VVDDPYMKKHHTKNKGDLGVLKAQADLCEKGYMVLTPQTEHAPFDLVVYKNRKFRRVQVKYRSIEKKGTLEVNFRSCWADRHGNHSSPIDKKDIDVFCVYCPETNECYYFDPSKHNKSITLRFTAPKNKQKTNIHLAKDYLKF